MLAEVVFSVYLLLAAKFSFWDCLSAYFSKLSMSFDAFTFSYVAFNLSKWSFQLSVFLFSSSFNLALYFTWSNCCYLLLKLKEFIIFCITCSYFSNSRSQFLLLSSKMSISLFIVSIDCLHLISFSYSGVAVLTLALNFACTNGFSWFNRCFWQP